MARSVPKGSRRLLLKLSIPFGISMFFALKQSLIIIENMLPEVCALSATNVFLKSVSSENGAVFVL